MRRQPAWFHSLANRRQLGAGTYRRSLPRASLAGFEYIPPSVIGRGFARNTYVRLTSTPPSAGCWCCTVLMPNLGPTDISNTGDLVALHNQDLTWRHSARLVHEDPVNTT